MTQGFPVIPQRQSPVQTHYSFITALPLFCSKSKGIIQKNNNIISKPCQNQVPCPVKKLMPKLCWGKNLRQEYFISVNYCFVSFGCIIYIKQMQIEVYQWSKPKVNIKDFLKNIKKKKFLYFAIFAQYCKDGKPIFVVCYLPRLTTSGPTAIFIAKLQISTVQQFNSSTKKSGWHYFWGVVCCLFGCRNGQ